MTAKPMLTGRNSVRWDGVWRQESETRKIAMAIKRKTNFIVRFLKSIGIPASADRPEGR
jgi:hypothetical protein